MSMSEMDPWLARLYDMTLFEDADYVAAHETTQVNLSELFDATADDDNMELDCCSIPSNSSVSGDLYLSNVQQVVSQGAVNGLSYVTSAHRGDSSSGELSSIVSGDSSLSKIQQVVSQGAVNGLSYLTTVQQGDSSSGELSSILQSSLTSAYQSGSFLGELASGLIEDVMPQPDSITKGFLPENLSTTTSEFLPSVVPGMPMGDVNVMEQEEPTGNHNRTTTTAAATGIGPVPIIQKSGQHRQHRMMSPGWMMGAGGSASHNNMAPVLNPPVHPVVQDNNTMLALDNRTQAMCLRRSMAEIDKEVEQEAEKRKPKRRNVKVSKDPQSVAARIRREKIATKLRVLETLVPGGTKMDTAAMLDETITYVKFLQLQLQSLETASTSYGSNTLFQTYNLYRSSMARLRYSQMVTDPQLPGARC
ncbi:unnamed protein product [Calypogeia fissa]